MNRQWALKPRGLRVHAMSPAAIVLFTMAAGPGATPALAEIPGWNPQPTVVIGQPSLSTTPACNMGAGYGHPSAGTLCNASSIAVDAEGNVYVADSGNNRVLGYENPWAPGGDLVADLVIGQPDFTTLSRTPEGYLPGCVVPSNANFCGISDLALDTEGNLYVADFNQNRVLVFDSPFGLAGDGTADGVFGQPDFTSSKCNIGGKSPSTLCGPRAVSIDGLGNVYIADWGNKRILEYDTPLEADTAADRIFGEPLPYGYEPWDVAVNPEGTFLMAWAGTYNGLFGLTVLYDDPLTTDTQPDGLRGGVTANCSNMTLDASLSIICTSFTGSSSASITLNPFDDNPYNPVDSFVLTALPPSAPFSSARKTAVDGSARLYVTENHRVVVYGSSVMPPDTDGDGLYDFRDQCDFEAPAMGLDADVFLYVQSGTPVKMFYGPGAGCTDTIPLLQSVLDALDENGMDGSFVTIDSNIYRGLSGKLGDAQKALDRRNTAAAVNKLVDFRTQVENWFWYDLYPNINHYLVTYANNLIELIGE